VLIGSVGCLVGLARDDLGTEGSIGREHTMEANEMEPGTRDECGQALQKFQRAHHEMGGSIAGTLKRDGKTRPVSPGFWHG